MSIVEDKNITPLIIFEESYNKSQEENNIFQIIDKLKNTINFVKGIIPNNLTFEINEKINSYFIQINNFINKLIYILNSNVIQNESLKRKDEQSLRIMYGKFFNQKLINEVLENKILILTKKEKEYELLKQKTGAIICNGQIICNERKDNEIIILRTENSLLKSTIKNNEDLLKEKKEIINSLNNDILLYKNQIEELRKIKQGKYSSFSNINININEPKKEYNNKKMKSKNYNINDNQKLNNTINNKNGINNIYSSYQMNSQLINRVSNNKNKINNKEEIYNNDNISKNNNKNETKDSINNKTYSINYISVNKSLFSPKSNKEPKITFKNTNIKNDKKTIQINRIKKNKYILSNNLSNRDYKTISIESNINNEMNINNKIINNRLIIKHKKSNSIQYPENSIKQIIKGKKEKSLSIESDNNSHIYSAVRKLIKIKKQSVKNNKSLPSSIINTVTDGFRNNNQTFSQKCLTYFLMPYADRKSDNRGRNENNSRIGNVYIKDNSLNYFHKTFMNRTSCGNNFYREKNSLNKVLYNNSMEICKNISPNLKNK